MGEGEGWYGEDEGAGSGSQRETTRTKVSTHVLCPSLLISNSLLAHPSTIHSAPQTHPPALDTSCQRTYDVEETSALSSTLHLRDQDVSGIRRERTKGTGEDFLVKSAS